MLSTQTTPGVVCKLRVFWIDDPMMMAILRTDFSDVRTVRANVRILSVGNRLVLVQDFVLCDETHPLPFSPLTSGTSKIENRQRKLAPEQLRYKVVAIHSPIQEIPAARILPSEA